MRFMQTGADASSNRTKNGERNSRANPFTDQPSQQSPNSGQSN